MTFENLNLISPILEALKNEGYTTPTPIQAQTIPLALEGKDVLGCAQTGTGKTAAFAIPIIQLMSEQKNNQNGKRPIRALILTPTRELAIQIAESFENYGAKTNLKYEVIFGGVSQNSQVKSLRSGIDVLIATPGRLLDLISQKFVHLNQLEFFVLDEADRMLDMGFLNDVKKIIAKIPQKRQSLFFSATMPDPIVKLANTILVNPTKVEVTPVSSTANTINQAVYFVDKENKKHLLKEVLSDKKIDRALVFTRTKHGADKVVKDLIKAGIKSQAIHGNKSQNARQRALNSFKSKETRVLVATDIAARGIDIDDLTHVINYELPNIPESYVHRIGRTGRAGSDGIAIAFCDAEEKAYLKDIQKLIGKQIPVLDNENFPLVNHHVEKTLQQGRSSRGSGRRNNSRKR
ncbi:DEAD/DEAH box helicase [uncultured Planktosalinus sp.]|uniref:DEAD/DEAH box helicase n=1 Tax=uncultured Planktosalinus sp. TaxID=1810935 RepID=UPI0030DB2848